MTSICTLNGSLPQGAPTSPALANLAAYQLDVRLDALTASRDLAYIRYADDLTISGETVGERGLRRTVERIMRDEGCPPNDRKVRFLDRNSRQAVAGVVVNDAANIPRDRRRWLRQEIYYLRKYGVDSHLEARGVARRDYKAFVYGHVYALHAYHPAEAAEYLECLDEAQWGY